MNTYEVTLDQDAIDSIVKTAIEEQSLSSVLENATGQDLRSHILYNVDSTDLLEIISARGEMYASTIYELVDGEDLYKMIAQDACQAGLLEMLRVIYDERPDVVQRFKDEYNND